MKLTLIAVAVLIASAGCWNSTSRVLDERGVRTDGDADVDLDPYCPYFEVHQVQSEKVDILFVIDNSNSMAEEQALLSEQIVVMIQELISPSDPLIPAVDDLHVGVISTDMGSGGYSIQTCDNPTAGDNGILQNVGNLPGCSHDYSAPDCEREECPWLSHSFEHPNDGSDSDNPPIWEDFGCIGTLGTNGCGFEQQLEASLVALTAQIEPGRPNEGFLRDDSLLTIIYISDEDDCSTGNAEMFNPSREDYGNLNVRCVLSPGQLYPVERYIDAFTDLRGGDMDRVVVAAITGVPIDGRWNPGDPVDSLREMQIVDPRNPSSLIPSCETSMGNAYPPVRFAELVYAFGNNGILESLCRPDWTPALQAVTRKIMDNLRGVCLTRSFLPEALSTCRMVETLDDDRPCPHIVDRADDSRTTGWQVDLGVNERGLRMCEILPADYDFDGCPDGRCDCAGDDFDGCLQGWFLDRSESYCEYGGIRLTDSDLADRPGTLRFECPEGCR